MAATIKTFNNENCTEVITEENVPVKRLRLVQKETKGDQQVLLSNSSDSDVANVMSQLLQIERNIVVRGEDSGSMLRELLSNFDRERNNVVRCKMISVIGELKRVSDCDEQLLENLFMISKNEKSRKVISQILKVVTELVKRLPSVQMTTDIMDIATQWLKNSNSVVRCSSLDLMTELTIGSTQISHDQSLSVQKVLGQHAADNQSSVRNSALHSLLKFHESGLTLDFSSYDVATSCLRDSYENVRLAALELVSTICQLYPERTIVLSDDLERIALLDDGFVKICSAMTDESKDVRTKAASLLGPMNNVSPRFLRQTLEKKLMSCMVRKISAVDRHLESYMTGEWASGHKFRDDAPREVLNTDDVSLMSMGACGAFIHGLEDEYLDVRNATLTSISQLASCTPMFAILAQDSIIDMFNDEIESVRLNAIASLTNIYQNVTLRYEQLEIILGVLQDLSVKTRHKMHEMLSHMNLCAKSCLTLCISALLENLSRYPQDKVSIWNVMRCLGRNHPELVSAVMPDVLCLHPYFTTPESNMLDPNYIAVLLMIMNAAESSSSILSVLPDHSWRHYRYLLSSVPHLVPTLQKKPMDLIVPPVADVSNSSMVSSFLSFIQQSMSQVHDLDISSADTLLTVTIRDLTRLSEILGNELAFIEFLKQFLSCQSILIQLINTVGKNSPITSINSIIKQLINTVGKHSPITSINSIIKQLLTICGDLRHLFVGLSEEDHEGILLVELKALALCLPCVESDDEAYRTFYQCFTHILSDIKRCLTLSVSTRDKFINHMISLDLANQSRQSLCHYLSTLAHLIKPQTLLPNENIKRSKAFIIEPSSVCNDKPLVFVAGLTTPMTLVAKLVNRTSLNDVRIQVCYPDMNVSYVKIVDKDVTKISSDEFQINTNVLMTHSLSSEPFEAEVCLVLFRGQDDLSHRGLLSSEYIQLCQPIRIMLSPKPIKNF